MRRSTTLKLSAALLSGVLAIAACSSSKSNNSSGNNGGSSQTANTSSAVASKPTGSTITIGNIGSYTSFIGQSIGPVKTALSAWESYMNDHGGINNHPVKVIFKDDTGDSTKALTLAKELVEQDHVAAIVAPASVVPGSWFSYVEGKKVPVIYGGDFFFPDSSDAYDVGTGQSSLTSAGFDVAKRNNIKKVGLVLCTEVAACKTAADTAKPLAASKGLDMKAVFVSSSAPNFTAACLSLKGDGVGGVQASLSADVHDRLITDCAKQNFKPVFWSSPSGVQPTDVKNPYMEGIIAIMTVFPWVENDTPATQAFVGALKQYANVDVTGDSGSPNYSVGWAPAMAFAKALANAPAEPTAADVATGLSAFKGETVDGLTPPLTFAASGNQPTPTCYFIVQLKGGKWGKASGFDSYNAC